MFAAFLLQLLFHLIESLHHFFLLLGFCIALPFFLLQLLLKFIMFYDSSQRKQRKKLKSKSTNALVFDRISNVIADSHAGEGTCKHIQGLLRVNSHLNQYSAHRRVMYLFSFFQLALSIVSPRSRLPTCKSKREQYWGHFWMVKVIVHIEIKTLSSWSQLPIITHTIFFFQQKTKGEICVPHNEICFF